jgi:uncharacterized protein (DUF2235 family)
LPFTTYNSIVRTFRHAVALDERRAKFKANHWNPPESRKTSNGSASTSQNNDAGNSQSSTKAPQKKRNAKLRALEKQYSSGILDRPTDVEEVSPHGAIAESRTDPSFFKVWFAGCHCGMFSPHQ